MTTISARWWSRWRESEDAIIHHVDLTPDAEREERAASLLDHKEAARWRSILSPRARREFALCRAALRVVLAERLGCRAKDISFRYLKHGKPVATTTDRRLAAGFNVSHSGRHGMIALSEHERLGVDVEERRLGRDLDGIGKMVFARTELDLLENAKGAEKVRLFFRLWSMKEALIKAIGAGFSLNPLSFEIPEQVLLGAREGEFRFPHAPEHSWRLVDLGERRFAAALAFRMPDQSTSSGASPRPRKAGLHN